VGYLAEAETRGELVFKDVDSLRQLISKLSRSVNAEEWLSSLRDSGRASALEVDSVVFEEAVVDEEGRVHVKFSGREDWPAPAAPPDENPVDWLKSITAAGVWESEISKSLDSWGDASILLFYTADYIEKRRQELLSWWMDALGDVAGGL